MSENEFPHYELVSRFQFEADNYAEDINGNPVVISRIGNIDGKQLLGNVPVEVMSEFMMYMFAKKVGRGARLTRERGWIVREFRIIDLEGLGMQHLSRELLKYLGEILSPAQKNLPENLYKCFIINAPSIFQIGWTVVKGWLSERTQLKITILGSSYMEALLQHVSPENLPVCYG